MNPDTHLTTAQVAETFGVSSTRIRVLAIEGRLPFVQTRLGRFYPRAEVEAIAKTRKTKAGRPRRRAALSP